MNVTMIGTGYVGLVSGTCFADFGHWVVCVDNMEAKIANLHRGIMPIYEDGLEALVSKNVKAKRLNFTVEISDAVRNADAVFIAVGTPSRKSDGHADLSYVYAAAREIAENLSGFTVIVTKSTVPVGTGDEVARIVRETNPDADFAVVSNPEFLREGQAIQDFMKPDRVVVGLEDERARHIMDELYRPLRLGGTPMLYTRRRTAEIIKYAANAFLATKVTFINEIADLCEAVGGDVSDVAKGIGLDDRIGPRFLNAGPGYGGSCFPKDTLALSRTGRENNSPLRIVDTVIEVNNNRKKQMVERVLNAAGGKADGKKIGVLGLTFKSDTDDMRDSPSIDIVNGLVDAGATVQAYDPAGMDAAKDLLGDVVFCDGAYEAAQNVDVLVLVTEWNEFRALDLERLAGVMRAPVLVDLRNIYDAKELASHGFTYTSLGRPTLKERSI